VRDVEEHRDLPVRGEKPPDRAGRAVDERERDQERPERHEEKAQGGRVLLAVQERDEGHRGGLLRGPGARIAVDVSEAQDDERRRRGKAEGEREAPALRPRPREQGPEPVSESHDSRPRNRRVADLEVVKRPGSGKPAGGVPMGITPPAWMTFQIAPVRPVSGSLSTKSKALWPTTRTAPAAAIPRAAGAVSRGARG